MTLISILGILSEPITVTCKKTIASCQQVLRLKTKEHIQFLGDAVTDQSNYSRNNKFDPIHWS